jgi:hypothetical protein
MTSARAQEYLMPRDYTARATQDRNSSAEPLRFEGGWSKAEFLALERRWSFLARLGEGMAEQSAAG